MMFIKWPGQSGTLTTFNILLLACERRQCCKEYQGPDYFLLLVFSYLLPCFTCHGCLPLLIFYLLPCFTCHDYLPLLVFSYLLPFFACYNCLPLLVFSYLLSYITHHVVLLCLTCFFYVLPYCNFALATFHFT